MKLNNQTVRSKFHYLRESNRKKNLIKRVINLKLEINKITKLVSILSIDWKITNQHETEVQRTNYKEETLHLLIGQQHREKIMI